ncbi:hypothetical protein A6122_0697 [Rathayibacter tritici]|uniref:Bacterial Ig domain-containing protein n=1 Tax=Rathayibacter tritici TaxID=33888 RepID=A0A160KQL4_9MICO|nr:hypothetical protein A6122_0697 [Rathayibacter tritici]
MLDTDGRLLPDAAGTAEPGATVLLVDAADDRRYGAATADATGRWTATALPLPLGRTTVLARSASGASAPASVDLRAPTLIAPDSASAGDVRVLVLADSDADGLELLVDGEPVQALAPGAPVLTTTIDLPAGTHVVGVRYSAPGGRVGAIATSAVTVE